MNKNHKFFCNGKSLQYARSKTLTTSTFCNHLQWICPRKSWVLGLQFNTEFQFKAKKKKSNKSWFIFFFRLDWKEIFKVSLVIRLPKVSDSFCRQFSPVRVFFAFAYFIATNISYRINHFSSALKTFCNPFAFAITRYINRPNWDPTDDIISVAVGLCFRVTVYTYLCRFYTSCRNWGTPYPC